MTSERVYSGLSPDQRDAERRRRLLDTGRELFGTLGFTGTSIERLCAESRVSTRHFYVLYDNKEAAFLDVYGEIMTGAFERALESLAETQGEHIEVRLPRAVIAYLGPMIEDVRATRIAFLECTGAGPRVADRELDDREALIALVEEEGAAAVERGEARDRDFRFATLALAGAVNSIVVDWVTRSADASPDEVEAFEHQLADLAITLLIR
ncbi:MAG: TetR/AcrR family transcriptional regulator [Nocardioidaceae bacterium]|nr:TetR/AcrR family transcriptional regulator [Nocardioidaceae bacterium]